MSEGGTIKGADGLFRCPWARDADGYEDYRTYHDAEWGRPLHGGDQLYERLCLEAFQSGLSWLTILRRREGFRAAFADFHLETVARFTDADRERLLADSGIIRNRAKIDAAIANARAALDVEESYGGGLDALIWSYAPDPGSRPAPRTIADVPATTVESTALAKDLKKRGFRFVGPTTAYALMQACGLVNDHLLGCHAR
ncbi:DNA-3-methyladenine glycosylase I [Streptantibioticus ferralitis]|uniref:DNA-3-methyladenine glycosylase I n=1 Tax=Streptantibioticus ferralitis TaxID=236510 RepID=A0ABT5YSV0_9ACTN|nr:DNA-3-methyladenine glycosylase I [Streptantibioticus ferralitis]MDF2254682.1 DNA-3-methyladenine glycosylase I [Streptantibioticus ferralitis]